MRIRGGSGMSDLLRFGLLMLSLIMTLLFAALTVAGAHEQEYKINRCLEAFPEYTREQCIVIVD